jgi:acetyltransferase-like isoleucine patch superfamily enzyme
MSRRVLIYEPVPNAHRAPIMSDLAATLLAAEWDVHFLLEAGQIVQVGSRFTHYVFPQYHDLIRTFGARCTLLDVYRPFSGAPQIRHIEEAAARREEMLPRFFDNAPPPDLIVIFNGNFHFQRTFMAEVRKRGWMDRCLFMEVGWFTQRDSIQLNVRGVNARSDLVGCRPPPITDRQRSIYELWRARYLVSRVGALAPNANGTARRLLVPLQVDTDTAVQESSPFKSMRAFIAHLEDFIPEGWEVVIKAHPKATYDYHLTSRRSDFRFAASGSIYDFIREADLVVGLNSTVLIEAALVGLPVLSFGEGVFTGNRVLHELAPTDPFPDDVLLDAEARDAFCHRLVFERQISLEALARRDAAHLHTRFPFDSHEAPAKLAPALRRLNAREGKSMIRIGASNVSKTASLDVTRGGVIEIGDGCEVRHHAVLEVIGKYNGRIKIGNNCVIGIGNWLQGAGNITIGDDVIIGPYTCIVSSNHIYDNPDIPIARQPLTLGEVVIEDDVWIGANATILNGVRIGAHSIIGANAFVNKDVPPYSIAVGSPARVVKSRKPG